MIKIKVAFLRADFYPANQSNLKSVQKSLIGWIKAGPPKNPLLYCSCKQATCKPVKCGAYKQTAIFLNRAKK